MSNRWHHYFLDEAVLITRQSKDPSSKVGAIIVDRNKRIVSKGFNGFPRGVNDDPALYLDREVKLARVIHAEANAILFAQRDLAACTLYCSAPSICSHCAAMAIQVGIIRIVHVLDETSAMSERWKKSYSAALQLCSEADVRLIALRHKFLDEEAVWES